MVRGSAEFIREPARKLLRIKFHGHWDLDTVDEYIMAREMAFSAMAAEGCPVRELLVLIDCSEQSAQSQDVVTKLQSMAMENKQRPRRFAVVVTSALYRRQLGRIAVPGVAEVFTSPEEALDWLSQP
jgi:hypothetical protein